MASRDKNIDYSSNRREWFTDCDNLVFSTGDSGDDDSAIQSDFDELDDDSIHSGEHGDNYDNGEEYSLVGSYCFENFSVPLSSSHSQYRSSPSSSKGDATPPTQSSYPHPNLANKEASCQASSASYIDTNIAPEPGTGAPEEHQDLTYSSSSKCYCSGTCCCECSGRKGMKVL
ncbi:hypothetical protein L873DRAFT_1804695 [Choiromyces venosus 120613-1]|uniref:Uncharacterized protein n=1 Tax=Choiromyces venosus 120613-1 TaxID=1336337 RepID=A0A3N4JQM6_9PEZI|nr:hypothetical protein L873DRAFT_1804695 [Choiromyces venosus 120613-1]